MPEWQSPHLHWNLKNEHVLFPFIVLDSFPSFLLASAMMAVLCVIERLVSYYHDKYSLSNATSRRSRWRTALWRGLLYWIAMVLRLCYMLASMSFNMGLLIVIATTLAVTQTIIEGRSPDLPAESNGFQPIGLENRSDADTLYCSDRTSSSSSSELPKRSRSKPEDLYIHPAESNVARAEVLAHHLDLEDKKRLSVLTTGQVHGQPESEPSSAHRRTTSRSVSMYQVGEDDWDSDDDGQDPSRRRLVS